MLEMTRILLSLPILMLARVVYRQGYIIYGVVFNHKIVKRSSAP